MHNPLIFRLAEIEHQERLAAAAQARQRATWAPAPPLRERLRLALSERLIRWGQRVRPNTARAVARS